ncbi:helix-turn-helix domain containing protein [Mitsuaria sp. GD03876]|uniref:TetR/AcrR family transcriptional regulator n=1 Tax=Mitsuaria sp. GD03876 TaxID=2975399 RepID=UPI00244CE99A|nr:helix-turn-helix domain containing protein [Mitsuaria sp. GD03876]MDH0866505.1 TetR/AcrR family transcriptional regulator [Mitsuaria sp. GD03876]
MPNLVPKVPATTWVDAAREALIDEGIDAVKVDRLAQRLGVTRGGFYHHFADHADLLARLLGLWRETVIFVPPGPAPATPAQALAAIDALVERLITEDGYEPRFDMAVRAWAHADAAVARVVEEVDTARIASLQRLFAALGCKPQEARIRARVFYFHQIGYYAIGVQESEPQRRRLLGHYLSILCGEENLRAAREAG